MTHYVVHTIKGPVEFDTELDLEAAVEILKKERVSKPGNLFRDSLLSSFEGRGLSEKQELLLLRLAQESLDEASRKTMDGPYKPLHRPFEAAGLKKLRMRFGELELSQASTSGANPGHLYVYWKRAYAGKITPLGWFKGRTFPELETRLAEVAADPIGAMLAYGREFGHCSCCGRSLSDPVSVWAAIGPVCLERVAGRDARREMEAAYKADDSETYMEVLRRVQFCDQQKSRAAQPEAAAAVAVVREEDYSDRNDYLLAKALGWLS